jgi:hypothetical protein
MEKSAKKHTYSAPDSPAITSSQSCQGPRDSPILTMALDDKSLVMTNIAMVFSMAHRNRWFTEL